MREFINLALNGGAERIPAIGDRSAEAFSRWNLRTMTSSGEIVQESFANVVNDKVYVAVGKEVRENESTLQWALQNLGTKKICILHVHQPANTIPMPMGGRFPVKSLTETEVNAYRESERQNMHKILDKYLHICSRAGVQAETVFAETDCIQTGIVELVSLYGITKLVIGAAADRSYSKKMRDIKSKKAIYVRLQAPGSCHIWFICRGKLIHTREGIPCFNEASRVITSPAPQATLISQNGQIKPLRSQSLAENSQPEGSESAEEPFRRVQSLTFGVTGGSTVIQSSSPHEQSESCYGRFRSLSRGSGLSTCSSSEVVDGSALIVFVPPVGSVTHQFNEDQHSSPPSVLEGGLNDELYDQLEQAIAEAENSKREAFEESIRRRKAEKEAIEAIRRAKASEISYAEELRQRTQTEEVLTKEKEELEMLKARRNEIMEELRIASDQTSLLEAQITESDEKVKELTEKIISAVELLQKYKTERDELEIERDNALRLAEELRKRQSEEVSDISTPQFYAEFTFREIEEATRNFNPSLKIGEGGYGSIFRGLLRHIQVAIKMLHSNSTQGPSEFQQEVDVLSNLRHPNLVTLIGACPEAWILIYEYLPNGSLEDRLSCKDNSPPLPWQARIRIAAELCSALIFLHSSKPDSIVHADVKPANILLDANFVSKLSDFGICRILSGNKTSTSNTTMCLQTNNPKGTFAYMDPEFLSTGELTTKSDVYSFGVILLRLLTGRPPLGIKKEVEHALDKGTLIDLLDPSAGDWPFVQAKQLAYLALRCCDMNRKNRPCLESEVWRVLEPMRASCGVSSSFRLGCEEHCRIPAYFICPIFQEVMQDPHVAADGFTYEAEALKGWLDSGHDTSPMTNLKLAHCNLVPNHALRSAIQEWLQQP